jgi:hypothetical protein
VTLIITLHFCPNWNACIERVVLSSLQICVLYIVELEGVNLLEIDSIRTLSNLLRNLWNVLGDLPPRIATQYRHSTLFLTPGSHILQSHLATDNAEATGVQRFSEDVC